MATNTNIIPQSISQEQQLNTAAFCAAFIPEQPPDLPSWAEQASRALNVLIDFRSQVHKWQAAGDVPEAELAAAYEQLDRAGLAGWLDGLIGQGVVR